MPGTAAMSRIRPNAAKPETMAAATVALGYLGCLLVGLPFGAKFVKELRHAGIIREV